jgi:hypothetical protein
MVEAIDGKPTHALDRWLQRMLSNVTLYKKKTVTVTATISPSRALRIKDVRPASNIS